MSEERNTPEGPPPDALLPIGEPGAALDVGVYGAPYFRGFPEDGGNQLPIGPDYAHLTAPMYANMRKTSIYGGSNEIMRELIARTVFWKLSPSPSRRTPRFTLSCLDGTRAERPSGEIATAPR